MIVLQRVLIFLLLLFFKKNSKLIVVICRALDCVVKMLSRCC